jgi:UDPglucose--hexose-1-phosphate uridylyltransferase
VRERRRDPLTGDWRTFASERMDRELQLPPAECPFCPTLPAGLETEIPAPSFDVAVFDDRFPPLAEGSPWPATLGSPLYRTEPAVGASEVVVYTDEHDMSFAQLEPSRVKLLVDVWADRYDELCRREDVSYVLAFENRGEGLGITLTHPHGQIYGYPEVPALPASELAEARRYHDEHGSCVVCDVVARELAEGVRVVAQNQSFLAHVPFAARFPYEVHVTPLRHASSLLDLTEPERGSLAMLLLEVTRAYDALFESPLSYVMAIHQAPCDGANRERISHLHVEFLPLHRPQGKPMTLSGSELGAGAFVSEAMPELTAGELRRSVVRSI